MNKYMSFLFLNILIIIPLAICPAQNQPLTIAESSNFTSTSRYTDVITFINHLQKLSPRIRVETIAQSIEGRDIPLIILGNPPPSSPLDLKDDDRMVVYLQGNIHAGEVEGKEGLQILARDIILAKNPPYLDQLVILIAPVFNPDGNEKISTQNRTRQTGPINGVGVRPNGQNLDLNRDGLKLESPEVKGLIKNVMNRWDPYVILDSHTHNGSYHEEPVTFVWSLNPNGDTSLVRYMSNKMYAEVTANLRDNYDILCIPHGDFLDVKEPEKGWVPLGPQPRYISNYIGLRNRLGILNENYPYADFETRVKGSYKLFKSILDFCSKNMDEIKQLINEADQRTIQRGLNLSDQDRFALDYDVRSTEYDITVKGWEMKVEDIPGRRWPKVTKTEIKKTYKMPFLAEFYAKKSVRLPFAYLFSAVHTDVAKKIREHGITLGTLSEPAELSVETFNINEVSGGNSLNQGHYQTSITGQYEIINRSFPEGTFIVPMAQPLANVASYLLEPESDDGLLRWNFFDRYLVKQWSSKPEPYPVYKLYESSSLDKISIH